MGECFFSPDPRRVAVLEEMYKIMASLVELVEKLSKEIPSLASELVQDNYVLIGQLSAAIALYREAYKLVGGLDGE